MNKPIIMTEVSNEQWYRVNDQFENAAAPANVTPNVVTAEELGAIMKDIEKDGVMTAQEADAFTRVAAYYDQRGSFTPKTKSAFAAIAKRKGLPGLEALRSYQAHLRDAAKPMSRDDLLAAIDRLAGGKTISAAQLSVIGHTIGAYLGDCTPEALDLLASLEVVIRT